MRRLRGLEPSQPGKFIITRLLDDMCHADQSGDRVRRVLTISEDETGACALSELGQDHCQRQFEPIIIAMQRRTLVS